MGRPPTKQKRLRDGFYIEVRNRGSKTGVVIRRSNKEQMLIAIEEYGRTKEIVVLGKFIDGELVDED